MNVYQVLFGTVGWNANNSSPIPFQEESMSANMFLGHRTNRLISRPSANSGYLRRYDQPKLNHEKQKNLCQIFPDWTFIFSRQFYTWVPGTILRRNSNRPKLTLKGYVRTNEHHDGPEWPHMSISSKTLLGHARQHPYGPVWTLDQVQSSKIVGDKGVVSQFNTCAGSRIRYSIRQILSI